MKSSKLANIIISLRKAKKLTQKELADKLGVSDKAVSRWETGSGFPNVDMIYQISKYFKISFYDLLIARMQDDNEDDELAQAIIDEFYRINKKNSNRLKIILISLVVIVLILIMTIIFTNSYNKFKVYKVHLESNDFYYIDGVFIDTKTKDDLVLNSIKIKNVDITNKDTVSVDLYYLENDEKKILYNFSDVDSINFSTNQSYIKIDDLSKYLDNLYLSVVVIDDKNNQKEFNTKLVFILDFSNNKIYKDENLEIDKADKFSKDNVKEILMKNGFEEFSEDSISKINSNVSIKYILSSNKISINYEDKHYYYKMIYNMNNSILEIEIYDENNILKEDYKYDIENDKVMSCNIGTCNNYKQMVKILNDNVLKYFE